MDDLLSGDPEVTLYTSGGKEPSPNEEPGCLRGGRRPVSGQPPRGLGGAPDRDGSRAHGRGAEGPGRSRAAQGGPSGQRAQDRRRGVRRERERAPGARTPLAATHASRARGGPPVVRGSPGSDLNRPDR